MAANKVADPRLDVPRKMLTVHGEGDRKPLAEDRKRQIGLAIERALEDADISKQDAAYRLGYGENQSPISRWISGIENPPFAKLWTLGSRFQKALVKRMAGAVDDSGAVEVRTTITFTEKVR